jgi:hypothetical protein
MDARTGKISFRKQEEVEQNRRRTSHNSRPFLFPPATHPRISSPLSRDHSAPQETGERPAELRGTPSHMIHRPFRLRACTLFPPAVSARGPTLRRRSPRVAVGPGRSLAGHLASDARVAVGAHTALNGGLGRRGVTRCYFRWWSVHGVSRRARRAVCRAARTF